MLLPITLIVNFLALAAALWLGLYVVIPSPRRLISWLAGLAFLCLTGPFLNILLALTSPQPTPAGVLDWLNSFLRFWEANVHEGANSWLQGWLGVPTVVLWHHVTVLMRPGRSNPWRWTWILSGYGVTAVAILFVFLRELSIALAVQLCGQSHGHWRRWKLLNDN